jgi:hypothetical protein
MPVKAGRAIMTVSQLNTLLMHASICSMFYIVLRKVGQNIDFVIRKRPSGSFQKSWSIDVEQ